MTNNKEDIYAPKQYIIQEISLKQYNEIRELMLSNANDDILYNNIRKGDIKLYGDVNTENVTDDLVKTYTSKAFNEMRWFNVDDIFTQSILPHQVRMGEIPNYTRYMTQGRRSPLQVFKEHLKRMGNPKFCVVYEVHNVARPKRLSDHSDLLRYY